MRSSRQRRPSSLRTHNRRVYEDRQTGVTTRVSVSSSGEQANNFSDFPLSISNDGRYVAFNSDASNLVPNDTNNSTDIFIHDNQTGSTERVSVASDGTQADSTSFAPSISANGQFVVFTSRATNLVSGDTNNALDVFVRDRQAGTTTRVSVNSTGVEANRGAVEGSLRRRSLCGILILFHKFDERRNLRSRLRIHP